MALRGCASCVHFDSLDLLIFLFTNSPVVDQLFFLQVRGHSACVEGLVIELFG